MLLVMSRIGFGLVLIAPLIRPLIYFKGIWKLSPISTEIQTPSSPCQNRNFDVHIFSTDPLIIYLASFVSPEEADSIEQAAIQKSFRLSSVIRASGHEKERDFRSSQSSTPNRTETIRCIEDRALAFQGRPSHPVERLQVVRYGVGEQFKPHYDWADPKHQHILRDGNRETSIFVYLKANCTGGGTHFPRVARPAEEWWCKWIDCEEDYEAGVTFKPIAGNGIFWQNLLPDGSGDRGTLHAGLPVTSGTKLGLNIWTKQVNSNKTSP